MSEYADVATLPPAPNNPLPYLQQLRAIRKFDIGLPLLSAAGGPVTRLVLAPRALMPAMVLVSSPQGARDVLARNDSVVERGDTSVSKELSSLLGDNLLTTAQDVWLPRRRAVQPIFTRKHVPRFAGHVADLATEAAQRWIAEGQVDLDAECRSLTLRALGRSILGTDLRGDEAVVAAALRDSVQWAVDRAMRPVNVPRWLPTRGRRRAVAASAALHRIARDVLRDCRADADLDAPLVRALMEAVDPDTGERLPDKAICDELVLFMLAGHETISTALTYTLFALGHRRELQERVAVEVSELGSQSLGAADVMRLGYTVQVLRESMRMCSPSLVLGRMVLQDIAVDGFRVQAGDFAAISVNAIHHDPEVWPDPMTFDPDRFSPQNFAAHSRWHYLPFGGGKRACLGDHFAIQEAALVLASIVSRVEITTLTNEFPIDMPLTAVPAAPVPARVRPRVSNISVAGGHGSLG